jgi:hypothetical protein
MSTSHKSLINTLNSRSHRTNPGGTPECTSEGEERILETWT